ncbi:MAG: hypothetical protein P8J32_00835 [bacterium]|nr:hypothetical protein [bacterium]
MKKKFRDILRESLQEQALSASFDSKLGEINILIDAHERELEKASNDMETAQDSASHKEALTRKIKELEKLIPLYARKKELMAQALGASRSEAIDGVDYSAAVAAE